jgi:hypothetical protein
MRNEWIGDFYDDAFSRLGITVPGTIVNSAIALFNRANPNHGSRRNCGLAVACLSQAGKALQIPFDVALLSRIFAIPDRLGNDGVGELVTAGLAAPVAPETVRDVAEVFAQRLQLPNHAHAEIRTLAEKLDTWRQTNRLFRPCLTVSLAGGCVWHVVVTNRLNGQFTREKIQEVTGVSKTTFHIVHSRIKKTIQKY